MENNCRVKNKLLIIKYFGNNKHLNIYYYNYKIQVRSIALNLCIIFSQEYIYIAHVDNNKHQYFKNDEDIIYYCKLLLEQRIYYLNNIYLKFNYQNLIMKNKNSVPYVSNIYAEDRDFDILNYLKQIMGDSYDESVAELK